MKIDISSWKTYLLGDIFEIKKGKRLKSEDQIDGDTPYIGAISSNNGVSNHIQQSPIHDGNTISLSYNGSVGEAYYQPLPFWATDDVNVLYFKEENNVLFNKYIAFFICTILKQEKYRYSYGRKWVLDNMRETKIKLPSNEYGNPDWQYMEKYIKSLHYKQISTKNNNYNIHRLSVQKWEHFKVDEIFKCDTTVLSIKSELSFGNTPFISRTSENNGCDGFVDVDDDSIIDGGCITIGAEGIYAFYQNSKFATGNKIYILKNKYMNKYSALFICTILNLEAYRYNYGRARILKKLSNEIIQLPITKYGEPDWKYMEDYIKSLPYGDRI